MENEITISTTMDELKKRYENDEGYTSAEMMALELGMTIPEMTKEERLERNRKTDIAIKKFLSELKPWDPEPFLKRNYFDDVFGRLLQDLIDNTDEGQKVYSRIRKIFMKPGTVDDLRAVLEFHVSNIELCSEHASMIDEFIENHSQSTMGWYGGITSDGERALRTMHISCRNFLKYCILETKSDDENLKALLSPQPSLPESIIEFRDAIRKESNNER